MEEFSLLHGLFTGGNYYLVIRKIVDYLDLQSLKNLIRASSFCQAHLQEFLDLKTLTLRHSWLTTGSSSHHVATITDEDINCPVVVCDDLEVFVVAFEPTIGWSAHVYCSLSLAKKYKQCLYQVDKGDFSWTQFIGNSMLSKHFLIIAPSTPEHEVHLWRRNASGLTRSGVVKQQMANRYSLAVNDKYHLVMYRPVLFTLFEATADFGLKKCWDYRTAANSYLDKVIVKVMFSNKQGLIVVWEKDMTNAHTLHFMGHDNEVKRSVHLTYLQNDDLHLKPNDMIPCGDEDDSTLVLDLTCKYGTGVLDLVECSGGNLLRRFQHRSKPQHGWVIHCRSVAPPKAIKALKVLPFIQYGLCLDLEQMEMCKKSAKDHWPVHVEYVAHNSTDIFYTDYADKNVIKVVRSQQR